MIKNIKNSDKLVLLVITVIVAIIAIVALVFTPSLTWVCILLIVYMIFESNRSAGGTEVDDFEAIYIFIADKILLSLDAVANDLQVSIKGVDSLFLPENKRMKEVNGGRLYVFSAICHETYDTKTRKQIRDYMNKELAEMRNPSEPLVVVVEIRQQGNRIYIIATSVADDKQLQTVRKMMK